MLTILGRTSSINVRKVLWTCVELALPFDQEYWGVGHRATDDPQFLAINPNGLVPVLRDGPLLLSESNTICRYLASKTGRIDLLPADPAARAGVEQWMDWQATELNTAWRYAFMALVRRSPDYTDAAAIRDSARAWNRQMVILDARLARTGAYVCGNVFTLADVVIGVSAHRWLSTPIEHADLPAVRVWVDRLSVRDGWHAYCTSENP